MKKSMILGILFLSSMLLVSCGKSPQEKIVGEWVNDEKQWGILITSDGIIKEIEGGRQSTMSRWEFKDTEPFELEIFEDGKLRFKYGVTFISDDEIEIISPYGKLKLKRKA